MPPMQPVWRCGEDIARLLDTHHGTLQSLFVAFARVKSMDAAVNANTTIGAVDLLNLMRTFDIMPTLLTSKDLREVCVFAQSSVYMGLTHLVQLARLCNIGFSVPLNVRSRCNGSLAAVTHFYANSNHGSLLLSSTSAKSLNCTTLNFWIFWFAPLWLCGRPRHTRQKSPH